MKFLPIHKTTATKVSVKGENHAIQWIDTCIEIPRCLAKIVFLEQTAKTDLFIVLESWSFYVCCDRMWVTVLLYVYAILLPIPHYMCRYRWNLKVKWQANVSSVYSPLFAPIYACYIPHETEAFTIYMGCFHWDHICSTKVFTTTQLRRCFSLRQYWPGTYKRSRTGCPVKDLAYQQQSII